MAETELEALNTISGQLTDCQEKLQWLHDDGLGINTAANDSSQRLLAIIEKLSRVEYNLLGNQVDNGYGYAWDSQPAGTDYPLSVPFCLHTIVVIMAWQFAQDFWRLLLYIKNCPKPWAVFLALLLPSAAWSQECSIEGNSIWSLTDESSPGFATGVAATVDGDPVDVNAITIPDGELSLTVVFALVEGGEEGHTSDDLIYTNSACPGSDITVTVPYSGSLGYTFYRCDNLDGDGDCSDEGGGGDDEGCTCCEELAAALSGALTEGDVNDTLYDPPEADAGIYADGESFGRWNYQSEHEGAHVDGQELAAKTSGQNVLNEFRRWSDDSLSEGELGDLPAESLAETLLPGHGVLDWTLPAVGSEPCDYAMCFNFEIPGLSGGESEWCMHTLPMENAGSATETVCAAVDALRVAIRTGSLCYAMIGIWFRVLHLFRSLLG